MTSRKTEQSVKIISAVLLFGLGIFLLLSAYQKQQWDSDIFWALKSGEWIFSNLKVPATDPFSYTFGGKPWVDFTWGFQVLVYSFFNYLGGWNGLFIFQVILTSLTFLFIYLNLRLLTSNRTWLNITFLFLVYVCAHSRLFIRPHLFEYFFVSLYLLLLTLYEKKGSSLYLYLMLPLQVLWVNIHSSAILGIFIAGSYAAGKIIDELRSDGFKIKGSSSINALIFMPALLPIVSLINPYGLKLVVFPFIHHGIDNADAIKHIGEWLKPNLKELFFFFYPFPLDHFAFVLLFTAVVISLALNFRKLKARYIFLLAAALYMATSHTRWIALFAFFAAPIAAANICSYLESKVCSEKFLSRSALALSVFMAIVMGIVFSTGHLRDNFGIGKREGVFPEGTVAFMKKEGIKGNIYNEYIFGGYLIHEYPEVKVFIDGRTPTVYSPYFFWMTRLAEDPAHWKKMVKEYDIKMALIKIDSKFCGQLRSSREWAPVSFDDVSILFLKNADEYKDVISRWGMTELNPCSEGARYKLPNDPVALDTIKGELERVISYNEGFARPHRLLGLLYTELGGESLGKAVSEFEKALAIVQNPFIYYDYAVALGKMTRHNDAIAAFKKAIDGDEEFKDAYLGLGVAYHDLKENKEAVKALSKYITLADDTSDPIAYKILGLSYFELGEFEPAAIYLKRAAFAINDPKELGNINYYLGNALFEAGEDEEGLKYYSRAIAINPEYKDVLQNLSDNLRRSGKSGRADKISSIVSSEKAE
ncbi:MAG: tetratricopeptide repeat protein [Deltaproteobacteria bacterium]|nr:tetratricopeptide repeat protein [Deltaproteobacteria bacterium]